MHAWYDALTYVSVPVLLSLCIYQPAAASARNLSADSAAAPAAPGEFPRVYAFLASLFDAQLPSIEENLRNMTPVEQRLVDLLITNLSGESVLPCAALRSCTPGAVCQVTHALAVLNAANLALKAAAGDRVVRGPFPAHTTSLYVRCLQ